MEVIMTLSLIFIILGIGAIWYISSFNVLQNYSIKINEAEAFIDTTLRKRFDLLNKSIGIIKANADVKEEVLENIVKLRSRKLTNFDLDRQIYQSINEFNCLKEKYPELKTNDSIIKIDLNLQESETEMVASRKYYNDIITDYNRYIKAFPSVVVAHFSKHKVKPYFDGKDMEDNIINDFKL